ncbi:MAG: MATE family efflux transporter [Thiotrichales bacterium]|nr:MATE family efflux transporter [Thiotrichales bacterium]
MKGILPFSFDAFLKETRKLITIFVPILIAQLAVTGLGVVDTIMSGRVGTNDLAAIGLGSSVLFPVMMIAIGTLMSLTSLVAKQEAKGDFQSLGEYLSQGIWLAIPIGLLMWGVLTYADLFLKFLPLSQPVFHLTDDYLDYIAWGLPGLGFYFAYRFFWEGLSLTVPTMVISLGALVLNIPLNAIFIYGWGPIKAYGAAGCGIASSIVMWSMLFAAIWFVYRRLARSPERQEMDLSKFHPPKWQARIQPMLAMGIPNSLALLFEASLFSLIAILIVKLGTLAIAAHQVALSYSSLAFMLPISISLAATIRSGQAYGKGSRLEVETRVYSAVIFAILVAIATALFTYFLRQPIVELYTENTQVLQLAMSLLVIAALYQVFDAIQVTTAGALRGLHSTHTTMWVTLFGYWVVGLGGGYLLTFGSPYNAPMGVAGFWVGILLGFVFSAVALQIKMAHLIRHLNRKGELV